MAQCYICGEEATARCSSCHEPICETHTLAASGSIKCVSCTDKIVHRSLFWYPSILTLIIIIVVILFEIF